MTTLPIKKFRIGQVLNESWPLISGLKWPILLLTLLSSILWFIFFFVVWFMVYLPKLKIILDQQIAETLAQNNPNVKAPPPVDWSSLTTPTSTTVTVSIILFILGMLWWLLVAMRIMMGVRQSIGLPLSIRLVFMECRKVYQNLFLVYVILFALGYLNFMLDDVFFKMGGFGIILEILATLILVYVSMTLMMFVVPLTVTKHYPLKGAIEHGFMATYRNLLNMLLFLLAFTFILNLSALLFGIALLWTMPMYYVAIGLCFRDVFGLKKIKSSASVENNLEPK